jgi:ABC-type molybdate transport system substrate-binding protein
MTVFAGAICTASEHAESARQFLAFLASPETAAVKVRHGMEAA